jgi:hypothetical protein
MKTLKFLFILLLMTSCGRKENHPYTFYYWKTHLKLDQEEKKTLDQASVPYVYTRFFDIDKAGGKFQPVGVITKDKSFQTDKQIVPTVFITNQSMYRISAEEIRFLAKNIHDLVQKKAAEYHLKINNDIQIDCDWTAGTRDDYFKFLKELKRFRGKRSPALFAFIR